MPDWVIWVILAAVLAAGEVAASFTFILGPIALAALVAGGVAAVGGPIEAQLAVFIVSSIAIAGAAAADRQAPPADPGGDPDRDRCADRSPRGRPRPGRR